MTHELWGELMLLEGLSIAQVAAAQDEVLVNELILNHPLLELEHP